MPDINDYSVPGTRFVIKKRKNTMPMKTATWDNEYIDELPDSCFLYIGPGGKLDGDGKTTPRQLRHLPYMDANGKVDMPHAKDALARIDQLKEMPATKKDMAKKMLQKMMDNKASDQNKAFKGSFKSVVDLSLIAADNGGQLPTEIQVLPCGEFMTQPYGPLTIDENVFNQMVGNFDRSVRKAVPVDVDHDGGKAAGWINGLINKGMDGLWAAVEWTSYGQELLTEKLYKLFSPEWSFDYVDPENSAHFGAVLVAGSLTNRPLFKELPLLVASDGTSSNDQHLTNAKQIMILLDSKQITANDTMNAKDILAKALADRSAEEVEFLKSATLTDEEKAQVEKETTDAQAAADQAAADQKVIDDKAAADKAEADKVEGQKEADTAATEGNVEACEKGLVKTGMSETEAHTAAEKMIADVKAGNTNVTITASELAHYKTLEAENLKAQEALRKVAVANEVQAFVANDKGGKILPKSKDAVVNFVLTCNDAQKKDFLAILSALPELKIAGEQGSDDASHLTAAEKINNLVIEKLKAAKTAGDKLSKSEAYRQVISENAELAKEHDAEIHK